MHQYLIQVDRRLLSESFEEFIRAAWDYLDQPAYVHGGHVSLVANHLAAAARGDIKRLLINIPPSCSKSSIVSVLLPAWVWTWQPSASFLYQTYSQNLTLRDAAACRRLIETDWYQQRWPHVEFESDDKQKGYYRTTSGGWRLSTTRGGRATGEHPSFFVSDDGLSVDQAGSKLEREEWKRWYRETVSTRGIARDVTHIIAQQRLHPDDPSSVALEENRAAESAGDAIPWHHVRLPMRFDPATAMLDRGFGADWRTTEGELLYPELLDESKMKAIERALGPRASRAQLQQDPVHSAGQMFAVDKLIERTIPIESLPKMDRVVRGVDRAGTQGGGCYTAAVLLGIRGEQVFILDVMRGQWAPDEVLNRIQTGAYVDASRYGHSNALTVIEQEPGSGGKESVEFAIRRLKGLRVKAMRATTNKESRAEPLANAIAFGEVYIVQSAWTAEFIAELRDFPAGKFKDQVDAASLAYLALVEQTVAPKRAILSGLRTTSMCSTVGCARPSAEGSDYCCPCCEQIAAFNDPELTISDDEHTDECKLQFFNYRQSDGTPSNVSSDREAMRANRPSRLSSLR